jgi:tRNA:m4X modification enzyme
MKVAHTCIDLLTPLFPKASLLGHMSHHGMMRDRNACFIEFGAGRGNFSQCSDYGMKEKADISFVVGEVTHHLKTALNDEGECTYVLVDRKAVRGKVSLRAPCIRMIERIF